MANEPTNLDTLTTAEAAVIVEKSEAMMFQAFMDGMPPALRAQYGISSHEIGGATAPIMEELPFPGLNRVIGLGLKQPATPEIIDELVALYGQSRTPFMVSVSPAAQPAELGRWLITRGFQPADNYAKMIRGTAPAPDIETALRIEPVDDTNAGQYAMIVQAGFQLPASSVDLFEQTATLAHVHSYIAYAGEEPAGAGSLAISGAWGALFNAATLPAYRRRGAQGAIMSRRIRDGMALGCRWFTTETEEDTPQKPNASYHNMVRTGFQLVYLRPNYIYTFD